MSTNCTNCIYTIELLLILNFKMITKAMYYYIIKSYTMKKRSKISIKHVRKYSYFHSTQTENETY